MTKEANAPATSKSLTGNHSHRNQTEHAQHNRIADVPLAEEYQLRGLGITSLTQLSPQDSKENENTSRRPAATQNGLLRSKQKQKAERLTNAELRSTTSSKS